MNKNNSFGAKLRKKRREKHITQEKLAEKSDLSTRQVSDIENGKTDPKLSSALRLCTVCGLDCGELSETWVTV